MKNVLIVDDEKTVRVTLGEWFKNFVEGFNPIMAENGKDAVGVLSAQKIDLVITDLNMPKMDGFELLAHINNKYPAMPTIVMTAFSTDQIKAKISELGVVQFLEKPLNYDYLKSIDFHSLGMKTTAKKEESKSFVNGISLTSFLQLIDMEKKTCTLTIKCGAKTGLLYLVNGDLVDAEAEALTGEKAAYEIICWDNVLIEIDNQCNRREKNVDFTTMHLLMEACRIKDEREEKMAEVAAQSLGDTKTVAGEPPQGMPELSGLEELAGIDGFSGAVLVTPSGETIQVLESSKSVLDLNQVGALANTVLTNAKKVVQEFSSSTAQFVHIEAENHHILGRCFNEAGNALNTEPGRAHMHLFLILTNGNSLGMAKILMQKVIATLATKFR
jgi:CheY-like chemotaxis protein